MKNRSYLISGAGSGIGEAMAHQIANASAEHQVILLGRNRENLERVKVALPRSNQHRVLVADLSDAKKLSQALRDAHLTESNLAGVIANAGVGGENRYGENDRWNEIIQTNLTGTYILIQELLPALRQSKEEYKNIVITSSILARIGVPGYSAYCASKAGLLGLTRSLAVELASEKILVNAICPGWVDTKMSTDGLEGISKFTGRTVEDERRAQLEQVPLRKMAKPEEVAQMVGFLLSNVQTSITGQAIDFNNGAWLG